jgi:hypothetical protein
MIRRSPTRATQWWQSPDDEGRSILDGDVPDPWASQAAESVELSNDQRSFLLGDLDQPALTRIRNLLWSPMSDPDQLNDYLGSTTSATGSSDPRGRDDVGVEPDTVGDEIGNTPGDGADCGPYGP